MIVQPLTREDVLVAIKNRATWDMEHLPLSKAEFLDKAAVLSGSKPYFEEDILNNRTFYQIHEFFPNILARAEALFGIIYIDDYKRNRVIVL